MKNNYLYKGFLYIVVEVSLNKTECNIGEVNYLSATSFLGEKWQMFRTS